MVIEPLLHALSSFYVLSFKYLGFKGNVIGIFEVCVHHLVENEHHKQRQNVNDDHSTYADLPVSVLEKYQIHPALFQLYLVVPEMGELFPNSWVQRHFVLMMCQVVGFCCKVRKCFQCPIGSVISVKTTLLQKKGCWLIAVPNMKSQFQLRTLSAKSD